MLYSLSNQKGFAALVITLIILALMFLIAMSLTVLIVGQQRIVGNLSKSSQAYFAAEAGIEDALLRLSKGMQKTSPYSFSVENATVEIVISDVIAWARTVTATGNTADRFRKVQVAYELSGLTPGLYYGAQVGDGGLLMDGNCKVIGNVFSNGNANLSHPQSEITETIAIASAGNKLFGQGTVKKDAYVDICEDVGIGGTLFANTVSNCSSSLVEILDPLIELVPLPITDSQIEEWKNAAAAGGTIGSYSISSGVEEIGPVKIDGDLTIDGAELIIEGTVWVTGEITIRNPLTEVHLAPLYESASGVIIGDGLIKLREGSVSSGSGMPGSYLMYISTSSTNPAISIQQDTEVDVLYSNTGWVKIENYADMRAVYAHGIHVSNTSILEYEIGLENAFFASGPGAGWTVTSWREIE
jgi:hypothetical protein